MRLHTYPITPGIAKMTANLDPAEYERRRLFHEQMQTMSKPEHIELARILRKHNVAISENRSGMFFDLTKLPQEVFNALLHFRDFVAQNTKELDKRNDILKGFGTA